MKYKKIRKYRSFFFCILLIGIFAIKGNICLEIHAEEQTQEQTQEYVVTFDTNGGEASYTRKTIRNGEMFSEMPTPARIGYVFKGWYTEKTGGQRITLDTVISISSDITLYAQWEGQTYNVNLNYNGGYGTVESISVKYGEKYGQLPTPQKDNCVFLGWYLENGSRITENSMVSIVNKSTLYAQWSSNVTSASVENLSYGFSDEATTFGYSSNYKIPIERFRSVFGNTVFCQNLYEKVGNWTNSSFGMSASAIAFFVGDTDLQCMNFGEALNNGQMQINSMDVNLNLTLRQVIESFDVIWNSWEVQSEYVKNSSNLNELCQLVNAVQSGNSSPVVIVLSGNKTRRAVVGYGLGNDKISVYDPLYPKEERTIQLKGDSNGSYQYWSYKLDEYTTASCENNEYEISYISYDTISNIWKNRSNDYKNDMNFVSLSTNTAVTVTSGENNELIASVVNGMVVTKAEKVCQWNDFFVNGVSDGTVSFFVPVGSYIVQNQQNYSFGVTVSDRYQGAAYTTSSDKITFCVNDERRTNFISSIIASDAAFSMKLLSRYADDKGEITVTGYGTNEAAGLSQSCGKIDLLCGNISTITIDGKSKNTYEISCSNTVGGKIMYKGNEGKYSFANQKVLEGESVTYVMMPESGYVLTDVLVDGISQGAKTTYTFNNVTSSHKIVAVYARYDLDMISVEEIGKQKYTGKEITPAVIVSIGDSLLTEGVDYEVMYSNNINPGKAKIEVLGLGVYGSYLKSITFRIVPVKGKTFTVSSVKYKIMSVSHSSESGTVKIVGYNNEASAIQLKNSITIGGYQFQVVEIGKQAFKNCTNIRGNIKIGGNIKKIGEEAFMGCSKLKKVTIGRKVTRIEKKSFYKCNNLKTVTFNNTKLSFVGNSAFASNKKGRKFIYPSNLIKKYKTLLNM